MNKGRVKGKLGDTPKPPGKGPRPLQPRTWQSKEGLGDAPKPQQPDGANNQGNNANQQQPTPSATTTETPKS